MLAVPLVTAGPAQAQTASCDQFRASLAARIDPSIGPFSLEAVPASTQVPRGAKVVGTCEGGGWKVLLRRGAAAAAQSQAAGASASQEPAVTPAQAAPARAATPTPTPTPKPTATPTPRPTPTPTPTPTPKPTAAPTLAPTAAPTPSPVPTSRPTPAAAVPANSVSEQEPSGAARATVAEVQAEQPAEVGASLGERFLALLTRHWQWVLALVGLPLAVMLGMWIAHRRAYDSAGLPRGPKLN